MDSSHLRERLLKVGTILLPRNSLFTDEDIDRILALQTNLDDVTFDPNSINPKTARTLDHSLTVKRIIEDTAGEEPVYYGQSAYDITSIVRRRMDEGSNCLLMDSEKVSLVRSQINILTEGSYISKHLDVGANPDYTYAVTLCLTGGFTGGEFVSFNEAGDGDIYDIDLGAVTITRCDRMHMVLPVRSGERRSLTFFYSSHKGKNRKHPE